MATSTPIPNCSVAIKNTGTVKLHRQYAQKNHMFPPGKIEVISFELAHHFFGFELTPNGRLYRNEVEKYPDGQDSAWYSARANFLPWGWSLDKPENKESTVKAGKAQNGELIMMSRQEMFEHLKDTWENHIEGRLISFPKEMSESDFDSLPPAEELRELEPAEA